jgi:hypothetical protein
MTEIILGAPEVSAFYVGDPDANAFHRFVREGSAYVEMGRVPSRDQVFLSYFLENKARDFYNQVVVRDEAAYTLEKFFLELFEFCFPVDFRSKQRKCLSRCVQSKKTVAAHVAEFSQIYNTIGLIEGQEKVVRLWNSLRADIRQEMYRKDLDPEISTWDESSGLQNVQRLYETLSPSPQHLVLTRIAPRNQRLGTTAQDTMVIVLEGALTRSTRPR